MHQKGFTVINNGSRENKSERDIAADGFIVSDGQFHLYSLLGRFKQARKETSFVTQERKEISSRINSTLGSCSIFIIYSFHRNVGKYPRRNTQQATIVPV